MKFNVLGGLQGMERALSASVSGSSVQTIHNYVTVSGNIEADGYKIATIVMQNIDDVRKLS